MDKALYKTEAMVQETHWWFDGRRKLFANEIGKLAVARDAKILDVGVSSGTNLRMLSRLEFSNVKGLDNSEISVELCAEENLPPVILGDMLSMPFEDDAFDFVLATDVIEHVEQDDLALKEILRVLKPGGHVIITTPAFMFMWGHHDVMAHHKRRYTKAELVGKVRASGLGVQRSYYFNYLLFTPILLARKAMGWMNIRVDRENELNNPVLNAILKAIFRLDITLAPFLKIPFGVSIMVVANSPDTE